jgi:hypothetical protein
MRIMIQIFGLTLIYLGLLFSPSASAQVAREHSGLDAVPSASRMRLMARLEQYVQHESKREYEEVYSFFDESSLKSLSFRTKEDYAKSRQSSYHLLSFRPRSSTCDKLSSKCDILGEADLQWGHEIPMRCSVSLDANVQNGEWYLSPWVASWECSPGIEPLTTTSPMVTSEPIPKKPRKPRKNFR